MLWYLFQIAVFFGAFALLNENGFGAGYGAAPLVVSGVAAFVATAVISGLVVSLRRAKSLLFRRHESVDNSRPPRV